MKKLEEILNLAPYKESKEEPQSEIPTVEEQTKTIQTIDAAIDKIDIALPTVRDLDASDSEMDDLAKLATDTFNDLIEMSMNVDPKVTGTIIQSASTILGHAVTAKIAKMDKRLRMVDLQLKKARLDMQREKEAGKEEATVEGEGMILDRTELLRQILNQNKKQI